MQFGKLALGVAFAGGLCSPVHADSIMAALSSAYNHNATLNAQRAATRAADEKLPQALAGYRPTVTASADVGVSETVFKTASMGTTNTALVPGGFGVTITQNLFNGFRTINSSASAEAGIRASRETLRNVEQDTLFNAAAAYADVIQGREIVEIRRRNLSFLREQLRSSQARLDVGEGTRTDLAQSQAQLSLSQAQLAAAKAQLEAARGTYYQVIGKMPSGLSRPRGPTRLYPSSLGQAIAIGTTEHPAIKATQHLVDVALFNVKVAEGALLPTLSARGTARRSYDNSARGDISTSGTATMSLSVPLYQGGAAAGAVRENKELVGQRRIEVDQSRDRVRNLIVSAWTQLQSARANRRANQSQLRAAKLALSGTIEERNVGQRTQLDVLITQNTVLQAEELLVQSRRAEVVAGYSLVSSIGRLSSKRLALSVAHYEPKDHYVQVRDKWFGLRTPSKR